MKKIILVIFLLFICCHSYVQINIGGKSFSFQNQIMAKNIIQNENLRIELPKLDFDMLLEEDRVNESIGNPFRYGKVFNIALDLNNQ